MTTNKNQLILTALESGDFETALPLLKECEEQFNLPNKCTPLHYACQHGRVDVAKELITNFKCSSIESKDENGCTPLHIAAQYGQIHALKYMLHLLFIEDVSSPSIKLDSKLSHALMSICKLRLTKRHTDLNSHTPLHAASIHGHLDIVQFLVCEIGCDPVSTNSEGQSCLHLAAQHGHLPVMSYLLEEVGCDMTLLDEHGRSPTYLAAGGGHLNVVKYMIEDKGADPYFKTTREWRTYSFIFAPGRSLVHTASREGHLAVIRYLVDHHGCDPTSKDDDSVTPLHLACQEGHMNIVVYLISDLQFDPNCTSSDGNTCLHVASVKGRLDIIKFLINNNHCEIKPNAQGNTPLHMAAYCGKLDVVKFFIEDRNCDADIRGQFERIPLHHASENGQLDIVQYLVDTHHCDPLFPDENQVTPLHRASANGHLKVVKYFATVHRCNPLVKNTYNNTPLHLAAYNGKLDVVKFFIEDLSCDADIRGRFERIPLHHASGNGQLDIVQYLVDTHHCDPLCSDKDQVTPLHRASANGHLKVVKYFTTVHRCNPLVKDTYNNTPLHSAAWNGKPDVVKFFIEDLNCEAAIRGQWERIPLHDASENGQLDVVQYLVDTHQCDPLCSDKDQVTPLHRASANGHLKVVKYFTTVHRCNPLVKDIYNNTPLHDAALNGKLDVVKFFVEELNCDPHVQDYFGYPPLFFACLNGHLHVVKFLTEDHQPPTSLLNTPAFYAASLVNHPDILQQLVHTSSSLDEYNIWGMSMAASLIGKHHSASVIKFVSDQPVRIFVMGNSGSGKTTLVKSLTNKSFLGWFQQVKGVAPFTAGIVPTIEENSDLGAVKIYDFAGHEHYYASHEMILQQAMHPLTLIAVDTSLPLPEIQKQLVYWLSVLSNASEHVHTVIIGSHSDQINSDKQKEIEKLVISEAKHKCYSNISNHRLVFFDCRYSFSYGMIILRFFLYSFCRSVRLNSIRTKSKSSQDCEHFLDFLKHIRVKMISITELNTRLQGFFKTQPPNLMDKKRKIQIEALKLLVNNEERILHCCKTLSMNGFFLLLPHNEDKSKSLLILDEKAVLSELHSCLERLKKNTDNGMFEEFELKEILSCLLSNQMDPDLAIKYLILTQFCTKVSSEQLMNVPSTSSTLGRVTYYFFPNLVNAKRPVVLWNTAEENYTHLYTWCLECTSTHQFFTPRYIHTLFIQLIQCESVINHAEFTIWEKGILLVHSNGSRCVIEVKDQSNELYLAMQCMKGCEMYLVEQRSMLISLIKSLMRKVCSILQPEEYLLDPECSYPPNKYTKIPISRITALSVIAGYPTVPCKVDDGSIHQFSVSDLLFFDSLHVIEESILHHILVNRKSKKYVPFATVKNVVKAVEGCKQLVKVLQNQVNITYSELYRALLKYTVFTDGQLYELAGKPLIDDSIQEMAHSRKLHLGPLKLEDLYDINVELTSIVDNWKDFGLALGLNSTTLQMIESKYYNRGVERCLTEVLVAWLKGQNITYDSSSITWEHLIDALKSLSMKECVDQVEQKLSGECAVSSRNNFSSVDDTKLGTESLSDVLNNVKDLTYKWFHFGLSLGLDYPTLMEIEASQHYEVKDLMITMLNKWLKDKGNRPSWRSLAIALNSPLVQEHRVAETIENEHKVTENSV